MTAFELDVDADLSVKLGKTLDRLDRRLATPRPMTQQPSWYTSPGSAVVASTVALIALGGPDQGHQWNVRSIVVGGLDPTVAVAGVADVYVLAANPGGSAAAPPLTDWRGRAAALPSIAFYGEGDLALVAGEELYVRLTGATNAQQVTAAARVLDIQESVDPQTWGL